MAIRKIILLLSIVVPACLLMAKVADGYSFSNSLKLGDSGQAVLELQKVLNSDPATAIALSGAGSLGRETPYFGLLTQKAVIKFQEKYASEILLPAGLSAGTGFVGPKTLQKLNILTSQTLQSAGIAKPVPTGRAYSKSNNSIVPQTQTGVVSSPSASTTGAAPTGVSPDDANISPYGSFSKLPKEAQNNVNFKNYDQFVGGLTELGRKQGFDDAKLAALQKYIFENLSTTTNLMDLFIQQSSSTKKNSVGLLDGWVDFLNKTVNRLAEAILPTAQAQSTCPGGLPFGGYILATMLCTCSGNWMVMTTPLPPTGVKFLSHYAGMQTFLNYSAPFSLAWLGCYMPGVQACWQVAFPSCFPIPSEGATTPFLGSA